MAKAKKQEKTSEGTAAQAATAGAATAGAGEAPAKKPAGRAKGGAKKADAARQPAKPAGTGGSGGVPLIDTSLAAAAAASMVLHRAAGGTSPAGAAAPQSAAGDEADDAKRETSTFKQLKQNLSRPAGQGLGGILGSLPTGKKNNQGFGGNKQVGRNQTFGSDVNRTNLPRRTGG